MVDTDQDMGGDLDFKIEIGDNTDEENKMDSICFQGDDY